MNKDAVWFPDEKCQKTRLYNWMQQLGFVDYDSFYNQSIMDIDWFWKEADHFLGLQWSKNYESVLKANVDWKYPVWFDGGEMNIITNALTKWADHPVASGKTALIWEGDDGSSKRYTFSELNKEVDQAASAFLNLGMHKGDIATIYMPMIPETAISMLALAKIGCIFSPVFSGYGAEAVATRIQAAQASYLITASSYKRRGKKIDMKTEANRAVAMCPTIKKIIVANSEEMDSAASTEYDIAWHMFPENPSPVATAVMKANDPLMILYTSGTTGKPKGAVHTHSGFPVKAALDAALCMDVSEGDTFFWYSDMGWMMGPFMLFGGLVNGAAIVLFEGVPDYPSADRLWSICDEHRVTQLGISPTLIRSLMPHGTDIIQHHDLTSLKAIGSTGEPWNPDPWMWLYKHICKNKTPIINYSGGTEISGGILGNVMLRPITPITFNSPLPGMDVDVFDASGHSVRNEVGELVIKQPWVGMTSGFWKENSRYEDAYWNVFPNTWVHGDWVTCDDEGFWTITGRSDDILNVAGKRLGPAEMESVLVNHPSVTESACIGIPHPVKGETPVCFIVLHHVSPTEQLKEELTLAIEASLGKALKPSALFFVTQLPKTRNGKVMRRIIKSVFLHQPSGDLSALENPEAVEEIAQLATSMAHNE
ncbi:AMP-binding protein [Bacillus testis]|uniref:AMP-binding protein n=1 Tax=Bacillus testis TaxID=1622072 RepID=UPI00067F2172|nr:AMP-binding protein [Bacillus testis]